MRPGWLIRLTSGRWLALWFVLALLDATVGWKLRPLVVWAWNTDVQLVKGLGR